MTESKTLKRKRSLLWQYYEEGDGYAKCLYCPQKLKTPTGVTTSLKNHLSHHYFAQYQEFLKQSDTTFAATPSTSNAGKQQTVSTFMKLPLQGKEAKTINTKIAKMIAMCHLPYRFVEEKGFVELVNYLKPSYQIPVSTTFSRSIIPELYQSERKKLQLVLKHDVIEVASEHNPVCVALTTDNWTSRAGDGYMSLTCHYLHHFEYKEITLGNVALHESHTGENLQRVLADISRSWCLPAPTEPSPIKIFIITDNATNMKAAINGTNYHHRFCFAHTLQLAISDAKTSTTNIAHLVSKARKIVGHYNRSSTARARLHKVQENMQLPKLKLIQDVETRWCSEYAMFERLLVLREAIAVDLSSSDTDIDSLSSTEWRLAEGMVNVLRPFTEATKESSGNHYPTASMVIPMIHCLKAATENYVKRNITEHGTGVPFARNLLKALSSRFPLFKMDDVNCLSTIVDPRYKAALFDNEAERMHAISLLKKEIQGDSVVNDKVQTNDLEAEEQNESLWDALDKLPLKLDTHADENDYKTEAINAYLTAPRIARHCNPREWWKKNHHLHPTIAKVAANYLALPSTQVASERVFSTAGNIVTCRRELLLPHHVDELTFLHDNLK